MLRTRSTFDQALLLQHPYLATDGTGVHPRRTSQVTNRQRLTIAEGTQHIHGLLGKRHTSSARHTGMDPAAREQPLQTRESESNRLQLGLEVILIIDRRVAGHGTGRKYGNEIRSGPPASWNTTSTRRPMATSESSHSTRFDNMDQPSSKVTMIGT